jgi:ribonuclease T2
MLQIFVSRPGFAFGKALVFCMLAWSAFAPARSHAQADRGGMPGDFDYYVLSLSWSPTYCNGRDGGESGRYSEDDGDEREGRYGRRGYRRDDGGEQCNGVRPYAFVLHGLWPQYERRGWPENCEGQSRPWVPGEIIDGMMDIMPSRRLVINEFKKHGICSGLDPRQYFEAARQAYRSIRVPEQFQELSQPLTASPEEIKNAFLKANSQLSPEMLQITCSRNLLREVRVCLTKDLSPRPCSRGEQRRQCNYETVTLPPVRGGGTGPRGGPSYNGRRGYD